MRRAAHRQELAHAGVDAKRRSVETRLLLPPEPPRVGAIEQVLDRMDRHWCLPIFHLAIVAIYRGSSGRPSCTSSLPRRFGPFAAATTHLVSAESGLDANGVRRFGLELCPGASVILQHPPRFSSTLDSLDLDGSVVSLCALFLQGDLPFHDVSSKRALDSGRCPIPPPTSELRCALPLVLDDAPCRLDAPRRDLLEDLLLLPQAPQRHVGVGKEAEEGLGLHEHVRRQGAHHGPQASDGDGDASGDVERVELLAVGCQEVESGLRTLARTGEVQGLQMRTSLADLRH
eukprot:scaffold652_cov260-Pinguiococcus_pyrenoidosus.AAC.15